MLSIDKLIISCITLHNAINYEPIATVMISKSHIYGQDSLCGTFIGAWVKYALAVEVFPISGIDSCQTRDAATLFRKCLMPC